jgi:hypothetical protein
MEKTFGRPVAVVFIDCSEDVMVERVLVILPPTQGSSCVSGLLTTVLQARATSSGRSDDNEETLTVSSDTVTYAPLWMSKRSHAIYVPHLQALLEQFTENIMPVMDYFEKKNVMLEPISAVQPPEKVRRHHDSDSSATGVARARNSLNFDLIWV